MAIHDGQVRELDSQLGGALDAAGFAHVLDVANDHLAAAGHDPAVHDERVLEHGGKLVADLVAVAGRYSLMRMRRIVPAGTVSVPGTGWGG